MPGTLKRGVEGYLTKAARNGKHFYALAYL